MPERTAITLEEILAQLKALGNKKVRAHNKKNGAHDNQFGVRLGDIRNLAKQIKASHELATALWETGNIDAQLLAILLDYGEAEVCQPPRAGPARSASFVQLADWLNAYVVKNHPDKEALRQTWMDDDNPWAARRWNLTNERIGSSPEGLDLVAILGRIQSEMPDAVPEVQWTMNYCLAGIGIDYSKLRPRAVDIGETRCPP